MKMKMPEVVPYPASYRDPAGFVFSVDGIYYRQVNRIYSEDYDQLMQSGLFRELTRKNLLVLHEELNDDLPGTGDAYKILRPQQLERISYASEWCPGQLHDAALLTLDVLETAISHGMILKDATPDNIQFVCARPLFIDTLSFRRYDPSQPWEAYKQFCECFLFPLYLHRHLNTGTHPVSAAYPSGIPATLTAKLLPVKGMLDAGAWMHLFLQRSIRRDAPATTGRPLTFNEKKLRNLIRHLRSIITSFHTEKKTASEWSSYYETTVLSKTYLENKENIFRAMVSAVRFQTALDLGCNNGRFSLLLSEKEIPVVAVDSDWHSVNRLYAAAKERGSELLPLCIDLLHPTPATGFGNKEHTVFGERMQADLVVALALVHHLVFSGYVPLRGIVFWLATLTRQHLIIEFIPPADEKVQQLIGKRDRYHAYDEQIFENSFADQFTIEEKVTVAGSGRVMYRMKKKEGL